MYELIYGLAMLIIGYTVGQYLEKKHYRSIRLRERLTMNMKMTSLKTPVGEPGINPTTQVHAKLVSGTCVISVDYFKRCVAGLRKLFGGNIKTYESLVDRARREAILRLKESCSNADQIINLRLETSAISKGRTNQVGSVEVLAYATAIYLVTDEIRS